MQKQVENAATPSPINAAVCARLGDLIGAAESLRQTIESERPGALLPTFILLRAGVAVDGMATELQEHAAKLTAGAK
jgi:hypothetical protein